MTTLKKTAKLIRKKKEFSVAVLPEGTRTITGKLGTFKKGGFLLALESGLDILLVIQMGSYKIQRKKTGSSDPVKSTWYLKNRFPLPVTQRIILKN